MTPEELQYLRTTCNYLDREGYLEFLQEFRFRPQDHVKLQFVPSPNNDQIGDLRMDIQGRWVDTILYETPMLALVSKAYFKFCDTDWSYDGQREKAFAKGMRLIDAGCVFNDFGTRRRRDHTTQDLVIRGLRDAAEQAKKTSFGEGRFAGTSNVHFAMKYEVPPVGTVAHEWFMGIAAATADYFRATQRALQYWLQCYGVGTLGIALTDTFGTPEFLKAFSLPVHPSERGAVEGWLGGEVRPYAALFAGVRQDSGDPEDFLNTMSEYYGKMELDNKSMVFSDSLNVEKCIKYKALAEARRFRPAFGIGTHLTSKSLSTPISFEPPVDHVTDDFARASDAQKSPPMNIVIKLSSVDGQPAIKLSDDMDKHAGDEETVERVKKLLHYQEHHWKGAEESSRWDGPAAS